MRGKALLLFACLSLFFLCLPAGADAFSIQPLRQTAIVDPGKVQELTLSVENDEDEAIKVSGEVSAFSIAEKTGNALFDVEDEVADWFLVEPSSLTLEPGQRGEFQFTVSVPETAEPGAKYVGLFARKAPGDGQVGVGARVASLLFLHVAGEVHEDVIRKVFVVDPGISFGAEPTVTLALENAGTIHVVPEGRLLVRNSSGVVLYEKQINVLKRKILAGGQWEERYTIPTTVLEGSGKRTVTVEARYGLSKQTFVDSITFRYISPAFAWTSGFALASVLILVFLKKRERRS